MPTDPKPSVGRVVHYVSFGTPIREDGSQAYTSQCRAAIVTAVAADEQAEDGQCVSLCVLNPTGQFFNEHICHDEAGKAGTWHWPERV